MGLNDQELVSIAFRLALQRVADPIYWADWEDAPELAQDEWLSVVDALHGIVPQAFGKVAVDHDRSHDVDGRELLERVQ